MRTVEREGEGTKFTVDRKIFTSDIWAASPWKLKIWIYLIGNANHTDGYFMGIPIKRGQIIRSYRTLAKSCGYYIGYRFKKPSTSTVRRFCEELTKEQRIVQRTVHCGTLFTICNYNKLQPFLKRRTEQRRPKLSNSGGTAAEQNKNVKNVKKYSYSLNSNEFRLSELLLNLILERRNSFKRPDLHKWARHIDLIIRKDGRSPEEIEEVIRWCQKDSFWQSNIISTEKLRNQFDQLAMKMSQAGAKPEEITPPYYKVLEDDTALQS